MTKTTLADIQYQLSLSIQATGSLLAGQLSQAKGYYRMACDAYGTHSVEAGRWDKIACNLQTAIEALGA